MFVFNSIIHNTVQGGDDLQNFILCFIYQRIFFTIFFLSSCVLLHLKIKMYLTKFLVLFFGMEFGCLFYCIKVMGYFSFRLHIIYLYIITPNIVEKSICFRS